MYYKVLVNAATLLCMLKVPVCPVEVHCNLSFVLSLVSVLGCIIFLLGFCCFVNSLTIMWLPFGFVNETSVKLCQLTEFNEKMCLNICTRGHVY